MACDMMDYNWGDKNNSKKVKPETNTISRDLFSSSIGSSSFSQKLNESNIKQDIGAKALQCLKQIKSKFDNIMLKATKNISFEFSFIWSSDI